MRQKRAWQMGFGALLLAWALSGSLPPALAQSAKSESAEVDDDEEEALTDLSSTGYIDSAVIRTRLHVRFDAANGNDQPDRAEFFYGKGGYYRELGPPFDPDAPGPGVALDRDRNIANQLTQEPFIETDLDYRDLQFDLEYAFNRRVSLFLEAAIRQTDPRVVAAASGLADVTLGARYAFVASPRRYLTLQLRGYLPTGDARKGLGTDHASVEPGLLYYQRFGDHLTVESELRLWVPTSGSTARGVDRVTTNRNNQGVTVPPLRVPDPAEDFYGEVLRYGVGVSYRLASWPDLRLTPVVELVGWEVLGGFSTRADDDTGIPVQTLPSGGSGPFNFAGRDADGDSIVNLKVGARMALGPRDSLYLGVGFALTDEHWYDEIFRLEYRLDF